jgi:hypothetical protein
MPRKFENLTGQIFSRLTVIEFAGRNKQRHSLWTCRCECGVTKIVSAQHLRDGTKSCGCLFRELTASRSTGKKSALKHGHSPVGNLSPTYNSFQAMRQRCLYPKAARYPHYGGAGVTICDRWNITKGGSFENFLLDLGGRPEGTTLGRFGDVGNYTPLNCKWMDSKEQRENWKPRPQSRRS